MQYKGDARHISLLISTSLLLLPEIWIHSARGEIHFKGHGNTKRGIFFHLSANWSSAEESSNQPDPDLTGNYNLAKPVLVSTSSSDVSRQTDFDSTNRSFTGLKYRRASINRKMKIKTSSLDIFRGKLFEEGISKNVADLQEV